MDSRGQVLARKAVAHKAAHPNGCYSFSVSELANLLDAVYKDAEQGKASKPKTERRRVDDSQRIAWLVENRDEWREIYEAMDYSNEVWWSTRLSDLVGKMRDAGLYSKALNDWRTSRIELLLLQARGQIERGAP